MRNATISKHRAAAVLQALVLAGLFLVAALSAGEQAHAGGGAVAQTTAAAAPKG